MKPTPRATKRPKARVMYHSYCANPFAGMRQDKNEFFEAPVAVIPLPTKRQAATLAKFANLGEAEKVEEIAKHLSEEFPVFKTHSWSGDSTRLKWDDLSEGDGSQRAGFRYQGRLILRRLGLLGEGK